jgi:phosphate transport system protein
VPRETFHQELNQLAEEVVELGREVDACLATMVQALEERDAEVASRVLGVDSRYKERGVEIDEECIILQARQAPVARDLRLIYTVQSVTHHLVRAGTLCEHICQAIAETAGAEHDPDLQTALLEMVRKTHSVFRQGLDVFEQRDIDQAHDLEALDDKVDLLYSEVMNLAVNPNKEGSGSPQWRVHAALSAHYLERIADHGVDIGEQTFFLVTGERMESVVSQYRSNHFGQDR